MRMGSFAGVAAAGLGIALTAASSGATNPNPPPRLLLPAQRANQRMVSRAARRRPSYMVTPTGCTGSGNPSFVAINAANYAGAADSAVLSGESNEACGTASSIGGGETNVISSGIDYSFIGAGVNNAVTGANAFVGSGNYNESSGGNAFAGGGEYNFAGGFGSFVGAGGGVFGAAPVGENNIAGATDSFVGAGDLNQIATTGAGSFIGGGGSFWAQVTMADGIPSNQISSVDSFVGAGDNNTVTSGEAFVGAGLSNSAKGATSFVGAGIANVAIGNGAFVGAGNYLASSLPGGFQNAADGADSFVGAGDGNSAGANDSFIGGGYNNIVGSAAVDSFVGGGLTNNIGTSGTYAVVSGGKNNNATGVTSTIGGGSYNSAAGTHATVPGGYDNQAKGQDSFAAGYDAKALNAGSFVWSDDASTSPVQSTKNDQFIARASGGYVFYSDTSGDGAQLPAGSGMWGSLSDRTRKTNIAPLDDAAVLAKVAALPISEWSYKTEGGVRHVGPMAQDFYAAFRVGEDNRHITSIDEDGVALAAIKALHADNSSLRADNVSLHSENIALRNRLAALEQKVAALATERSRR